jgi:hypothetical protein
MTTAAPPSSLSVTIDHAKHGRRVALCCPPDRDGNCRFPRCGKYDDKYQLVPHTRKEVGKAPIGRFFPKGINDATSNTPKLDAYLREIPDANVSVDLASTNWLVVDTDSAETEAVERAHGLDGAVIRESRHRAYVFERPVDCPTVNLIKKDGDPLDILTIGNFLVHGTHGTGVPIRMDPNARPAPAPARYVEMLKRKAAEDAARDAAAKARHEERAAQYGDGGEPPVRLHRRGRQRWAGELVATTKEGKLDRDLSLFFLALDLAECNAGEGAIVAALEERDEALGWRKFTGRGDAERRYTEIAEKAVARAIELENTPRIQFSKADRATDDVGALRAQLDAAEAEITRLRRALMDRDDRLAILEPIVNQIDEIIARPEGEREPDERDETGRIVKKNGPTSDDKLVAITIARWMPHYRNKQLADGKPETITLGYLETKIGMPGRRISTSLHRMGSEDPTAGAPWNAYVTRELKFDDDGRPIIDRKTGKQAWESILEVIPWGDAPTMLRAAAAVALPELPKHGGSEKAAAVRWGRCQNHDNQEVRVKGFCPDCGRVVGERIVTVEEFEALNVQLGHSEPRRPTVSSSYLIERQNGHSGGPERRPERQDLQVVDSDADRAAAMVATDTGRPVDQWKHVKARANGRSSHNSHGWLSQWDAQPSPFDPVDDDRPDDLVLDPPRCIRPGCPESCGPGDELLCAAHRAEANTPAAVAGGSE